MGRGIEGPRYDFRVVEQGSQRGFSCELGSCGLGSCGLGGWGAGFAMFFCSVVWRCCIC